jgi:hypothetical protein
VTTVEPIYAVGAHWVSTNRDHPRLRAQITRVDRRDGVSTWAAGGVRAVTYIDFTWRDDRDHGHAVLEEAQFVRDYRPVGRAWT